MPETVNTPQEDCSTVPNGTVEQAAGGLSLRVIAATAGVSPATVLRDLRKVNPDPGDGTIRVGKTLGIDGKVRPNRRFYTGDRDAEILRRRDDGETIRAIAAAVGCSVGTVHRVVKRGPS